MPAPVGTYLVGGPILDTTGALITPTEELYRFGAISLREGIPHRVERFGEVGNYTYRWVPAILLDDTMQANATSRVGLSEAFKTQLAELGASQFHTFGWALDRIYRSEDFFGPDGSAREIVGMEAFDGIPVAIDSTGRIGRFGGTIIEPSNIDVLANHVILAMAKNAIYGFISTETHAFEYTIDATTGAWTSVAPNGVQANAIVDMSIPPGVTSSIWLLQVREGQDDLRIQNFSLNNGRLGGVDFGLTWALADAQAAYPDLPLTSLTQVQALAASGTLAGDTVLVYCRTDDHAFTMSFLVTGVTPNITLTARPAESHRIGYVDHLSGATLLASHEFVSTQYVVRRYDRLPSGLAMRFRGEHNSSVADYALGDVVYTGDPALLVDLWTVGNQALANANAPGLDQEPGTIGWELLTADADFRGTAPAMAIYYRQGWSVHLAGDDTIRLCLTSGSYTAAQIGTSSNWSNLTAGTPGPRGADGRPGYSSSITAQHQEPGTGSGAQFRVVDVSGSTQRLTYRHLPSADGALIVSLIAGTTIHLHGGVFTADGTTGASGGTEHFVEGTWDTEPTFSDGVSYRALITQARPGARGPAGAGADIDVEVNGTSISTAASEINFTGPVSGSKAPGTEDVTLHLADPADYGIPKVARIPSAFGGEILHLEHDYAEGTQQDITITVGFSGGFAGFDADALYGDYGSISVDENNTPVAALVGTGTAASYNITRVAGATHWIDLLDRVSIAGTEHLLGDAYFLNGERTRDLATPPVNLTAATLTFNARYDADWYWTDGTEPVLAGLWSWDEELTPNAYKRGGGIEVQKDGTIVDPDSRGLDFRGPSVSVQQESGVSEVHVADANHLAIKKVAVIPPAFDETVLYLPHNYTEGVKQDVTVTVGFGNGFAGYDTSIVGRFGSLSVGSVPFRGLIGQGDATGYSIDRVGGDQHWMYALTSVEINGTVHQLGDPYYIGGTLVRNILSPPTGLTGATFGFNAQLMPGFWYFTDGSTERVSAGLWEWDTDQTQYNRLTAGGARNLGNLVVDNQGGTAFDLGETLRPGATYGFLIRPSAANFAAAYAECPGIVIQSLAIQTTAPSTAVGAIGLKVTWDDDAPEDFSHANLFVWYGGANTIYLAYGRGGTISRTVDVYRMN